MPLIAILEFAFVTLGVKLLLGVVAVYALFPSDHACPECDAETLPLQAGRGFAAIGRVLRLRRRWCPACGSEYLARYRPDQPMPAAPAPEESAHHG